MVAAAAAALFGATACELDDDRQMPPAGQATNAQAIGAEAPEVVTTGRGTDGTTPAPTTGLEETFGPGETVLPDEGFGPGSLTFGPNETLTFGPGSLTFPPDEDTLTFGPNETLTFGPGSLTFPPAGPPFETTGQELTTGFDETFGDTSDVLQCDPLGDDCPSGFVCSFADFTCYPSSGTGGLDEPCSITDASLLLDDCAGPLVCAFAGEDALPGGAPRCALPCDATTGCPAGSNCVLQANRFGVEGLCLSVCDPLQPEIGSPLGPCPVAGDGCYPLLGVGGALTTGCIPAGQGQIEDPCAVPNDCGFGLTCVDAVFTTNLCSGFDRCCTQVCDPSNPLCVGADFACTPLNLPQDSGLGFCSAPL